MNKIDELAMKVKQAEALEAEIKKLKGEVANAYGEGKHAGEQHSVLVTLYQRSTVAWKKVAEQASVPAEIIAKNTSTTSIIKVEVKA